MAYRWKPNATQRREFAERMKDPVEQEAYQKRKTAKTDKRRAGSKFEYVSAVGNHIPTQFQYKQAVKFLETELTPEQEDACNQVMYGYSCQEKIHHDHIHIVNEFARNQAKFEPFLELAASEEGDFKIDDDINGSYSSHRESGSNYA